MPPNADDSIEAVHRKKKHYHEIKYPETTPEGVRQKGFSTQFLLSFFCKLTKKNVI